METKQNGKIDRATKNEVKRALDQLAAMLERPSVTFDGDCVTFRDSRAMAQWVREARHIIHWS